MDTEPSGPVSDDGKLPRIKTGRGIKWQGLLETPDTANSLALKLLDSCLMIVLREKYPDLRERTGVLQAKYQDAFKRMLAADDQAEQLAIRKGEIYEPFTPEERRKIVFFANCAPVGYATEKKTTVCKTPLLCPWCFARNRLIPASEWLTALLPEIGSSHCLLYWEQLISDTAVDPAEAFFRRDRGPHNLFSARRYLQVATIGYDLELKFYWRVSGYALIPNITTEQAVAQAKKRYPQLTIKLFANDASQLVVPSTVYRLFSSTMTVPMALYHKRGMEFFTDIYRNRRDGSKLFRKGGK